MQRDVDELWMRQAIDLAVQGQGSVEPNPMVGCILVRDGHEIGRGFHQKFGQAHAEINALESAGNVVGATAYVTLEPCCHQGKTGPCTNALINADIARVVVATQDPYPEVSGKGISQLRDAGIRVDVGVLKADAIRLNAPYFKRVRTGRPWVIAKWAMTLDGKIASRTSDSQWISNEASREFVHALRGRMDAIIVGIGTAHQDNPLLTARPSGPRIATRVVFDRRLELSTGSQLIRSADQAPLLLIAQNPQIDRRQVLEALGCQVYDVGARGETCPVTAALDEFGRRGHTNVLIEGGGGLLGAFFDAGQVDEVLVFVAPKIIGGSTAKSAIEGLGVARIADAFELIDQELISLNGDICIQGRVARRT